MSKYCAPTWRRCLATAAAGLVSLFWCSLALAQEAAPAAPAAAEAAAAVGEIDPFDSTIVIWWGVSLACSILALVFARNFYQWLMQQNPGDPTMVKIAGYVTQGANAYLAQQYRIVIIFFVVVSAVLAVVAFGFGAQSKWVPFAFLSGGFFSGLAGWCGMKTATAASNRTAQGAKESLNQGLQVAFRSGAVMGLTVVGLGLLDICLWFAILYWGVKMELVEVTVTMLCFGMGASAQALFARVGGGIFTKAADVGADLVGKVEAGIPEDDPRNPAVIADNVGDNVGDVAGMGADLYESYCGSILASAALGVAAYNGVPRMQAILLLLPLALAGLGILLSIFGIYQVRTEEGATQKNLLAALAKGINIAAIGISAVALGLVYFMLVAPTSGTALGDLLKQMNLPAGNQLFGVFGAIVVGLFSGVIIGWWTEYSTSQEYNPTKRIADQAVTGPATVIIAGIAEGFYSCWVPIVVVCVAILLSFGFCTGFDFASPHLYAMGLYGVGISAVGMLSTLGITLATDAYGPIADNAGGNAEMSHQDPEVRRRTDALDSLGNTTAATGKGFAIGSAALTALALLAAYVEEVRVGFERWAQNQPDIVAAADNTGEVSVVKLNNTAFAVRDVAKNRNTAYLVFRQNKAEQYTNGLSQLLDKSVKPGEKVTLTNLKELEDESKVVSAAVATIPDYVRYYDITIMNPKVLVGTFLGVMITFVFCALTMKAVGRAAGSMVEEVRRQFREKPGIMKGTAEPDYASCVAISTAAAQKEMVVPSILGLVIPVIVGMLLGVAGVMGLLTGGLVAGFAVAVMMANAGGAWDNAKKYVEGGAHGGKGTVAHKATVVGDTVGDPFKDTSGPSLNILIKLMSMVSVVVAGLVVQSLFQLF